MFPKTILAVFFISLLALAGSTFVQSSREPAGEVVRGNNATIGAAAKPVTDPRSGRVVAGSAGAQMNNANPDHEREPQKKSRPMANAILVPLQPLDHTAPMAGQPVDFRWSEMASAPRYRLEVEEAHGKAFLSAVLPPGVGSYRMASWRLGGRDRLRWRVVALDSEGKPIADTPWRTLLPLSSECEN